MALSNILREPRRELIELAAGTIAGTLALVALLVVWCTVAAIMCWAMDGTIFVERREFGAAMLATIPVVVLILGFLFAFHAIGEAVCNTMAKRGRDPRPTQRYR